MEILDVKAKTSTTLGSVDAQAEFTITATGTKNEMECFMENVGDFANSMCDIICGDREHYCEESHPIFGGAFYNECGELIYIKKVVYNKEKKTVAVVWNDGVTTKSTCAEDDTFNKDTGLLIAVMKKLASSDFTTQLLMDWATTEDEDVVIRSIKDVRRLHKDLENI